MFVANTADAFQHLFLSTLRNMLSPNEAGSLILVLANSMQDDELRTVLSNEIESMFKPIQSNIKNKNINITDDDLAVFRALEQTGIQSLTAWKTLHKASWEMMFNPMRALRPARASSEVIKDIKRPFEQNKFNFNKPFLRPEILWEGSWQETRLRVLYNKFPFAPYHLIIVPDPDRELVQYLTAGYHCMMWDLLEQQQSVLPGFGVGYNSLGACASVNQLHFQSFMREDALPVELRQWQHNGGNDPYPMNCFAFDSMQECWQLIDEYHQNNQPYNLLYRPGRCYVLPRRAQGSMRVAPRVQGAGWIEECGVFNVYDASELETVSADEISDCLRSLSVSSS